MKGSRGGNRSGFSHSSALQVPSCSAFGSLGKGYPGISLMGDCPYFSAVAWSTHSSLDKYGFCVAQGLAGWNGLQRRYNYFQRKIKPQTCHLVSISDRVCIRPSHCKPPPISDFYPQTGSFAPAFWVTYF